MRDILKRLLLIKLVCSFMSVLGQPPAGYYDSAANLYGQDLFLALNQTIKNHNVQTYSSLWTHFLITDLKADSSVWCMYSDNPGGNPPYKYIFTVDQCGNYSKEGDCYNREHSWPVSWFGGSTSSQAYTDLFHIFPTDGFVNSKRSNYPYGMVSSPTWTSMNGSKLGQNTFPGYSGIVFEPIDEYKGDFARAFFYMTTRYYDEDSNWSSSHGMNDKSALEPWAVNLLYQWHLADSVSQKEIDRNNAVFSVQGNRNPYVDNAFWVESIWGPTAGIYSPETDPEVRIIANPVKDKLEIKIKSKENNTYSIKLFSVQGVEIMRKDMISDGKTEIDIGNLKAGVYILSIKPSTAGNTVNRKIIIKR